MDEIYIRKVCDGDTESFRYFLKNYKDMAFSLAISIVKDEFLAEEIVQDSFMKAFNGLKTFNQKSKFSSWFYRIVVNESFMHLKKMKRKPIQFQEEYDNEIADDRDLSNLQHDEQVHLINEALKKLAANESLALRIFYLEEESVKTLCEITGWSASNAKVTLHRARKNMLVAIKRLMKLEY